jgi:hypothetical protein
MGCTDGRHTFLRVGNSGIRETAMGDGTTLAGRVIPCWDCTCGCPTAHTRDDTRSSTRHISITVRGTQCGAYRSALVKLGRAGWQACPEGGQHMGTCLVQGAVLKVPAVPPRAAPDFSTQCCSKAVDSRPDSGPDSARSRQALGCYE